MATRPPALPHAQGKENAAGREPDALHDQLHALIDATQRARRALRAGDHAMDFCLIDLQGKKVSLAKSLIKGPVLLLISRGPWCPKVREQLLGLAAIYPQLLECSVSMIALAPDWHFTADVDEACARELANLPFAMLTDEGCEIAGIYGLTFHPDVELRQQYQQLGYCDQFVKDADPLLVPATYLISRAGEIIFAMIDSDPGNFLKPETLLRMLGNMSHRHDF